MPDTTDTSTFSHHDPQLMQNPYPFYAEVRGRCPVAHSDQLGGFFFAVRHDSVRQVLSDFQTFTSTQGVALPGMAAAMYPVDLDPPLQTKFRKVLNRFFSVEEAERRRAGFQVIVDDLIDTFIQDGHADIAGQLTRPALNAIMLPLLGIPSVDQQEFTAAIDYLSNSRTDDEAEFLRKNAYVVEYLGTLSASRRREARQGDDYIQFLLDEPIDGGLLDDEDICKVLLVTLFGALDTTHATLNESILHLSRHPEDKHRLSSGEVPWASAIEEFVRYASPIQGMRRTATRELEFNGVALKPGDPIIALNAAGNRDPAVFHEPDQCVITRDASDHLGFGAGAHVCLGRNFARVIIHVVLGTMLRRMPDFAVPADFVPSYTVGEGRRMKALALTFSPGSRLAP
jgi:cytochrome P450